MNSSIPLSRHIEASMRAMGDVRLILHKGNPARLDRAMAAFHKAFEPVQQWIETVGISNISNEDVDRLRQLKTLHHKAMRSTMGRMHNMQEDIQVIEQAIARIHQTAQLAGPMASD